MAKCVKMAAYSINHISRKTLDPQMNPWGYWVWHTILHILIFVWERLREFYCNVPLSFISYSILLDTKRNPDKQDFLPFEEQHFYSKNECNLQFFIVNMEMKLYKTNAFCSYVGMHIAHNLFRTILWKEHIDRKFYSTGKTNAHFF